MNNTIKGFYSEAIKQRLFAAKKKTYLVLGENYHIVSDQTSVIHCFCGAQFESGLIKWDDLEKTTTLFCPECVRAFSQTMMLAKRMKYSEMIYTLQELAETGFNPLALALVGMLVYNMEARQKKRMYKRRKHELPKGHHKRA